MARILLIDEDPSTADLVRSALTEVAPGAEMITALTGKDGFRDLVHLHFDVCILDYALPDMTGVQLCTLMRQMGCRVPMIFFTAMDRAIDRERALTAGCQSFLSKPDDLYLLKAALAELLARASDPAYPVEFARAA